MSRRVYLPLNAWGEEPEVYHICLHAQELTACGLSMARMEPGDAGRRVCEHCHFVANDAKEWLASLPPPTPSADVEHEHHIEKGRE